MRIFTKLAQSIMTPSCPSPSQYNTMTIFDNHYLNTSSQHVSEGTGQHEENSDEGSEDIFLASIFTHFQRVDTYMMGSLGWSKLLKLLQLLVDLFWTTKFGKDVKAWKKQMGTEEKEIEELIEKDDTDLNVVARTGDIMLKDSIGLESGNVKVRTVLVENRTMKANYTLGENGAMLVGHERDRETTNFVRSISQSGNSTGIISSQASFASSRDIPAVKLPGHRRKTSRSFSFDIVDAISTLSTNSNSNTNAGPFEFRVPTSTSSASLSSVDSTLGSTPATSPADSKCPLSSTTTPFIFNPINIPLVPEARRKAEGSADSLSDNTTSYPQRRLFENSSEEREIVRMFYGPMNKMAKWLLKPGEEPDFAAKKRRFKRYKNLKSFCTAVKIMVHLGVLGYCIY